MSRIQPPPSFNFRVTFDSITSLLSQDAYFQEVTGIGANISYEEVREGGSNDWVYYLPQEITYQNLVLKRGLASFTSDLILWCFTTLGSAGSMVLPRNIVVSLLKPDGMSSYMNWFFFNAYPVNWSVSDFNAKESELAIETIEIKYSKMIYSP